MTVAFDVANRGWSQGSTYGSACLADKFEILKEIGDGSFGSVALGRVRSGGAHIARRGTMVAVKTMKKTFDSFALCLELREVVFLRTLPCHPHLVPALDIFLDPSSKKLHIAMEYMDGNLYQLMKARDHKPFDNSVVKSILFQILSGLEHIHHNGFFHRDIKPENILVSISAREDLGSAFKRYSQLMTPPSTPPSYSIKIADFGLAREINSKTPYTTYVSTRWYRAPEVLLRAGEYSAPVDMWATGAMAVEIATLKPLFPGGNEVDQVWRVCEIMGSPGNWVNRQGIKVGGGQWKDGVKLAQKLGFSFPKMAPHMLDTILQAPQWPAPLCDFVTWCLMWDPNARPTSSQALSHDYFNEAFDPLSSKLSSSRRTSRKQSELNHSSSAQSSDAAHTLTSKTSAWFRKSLVARESAPTIPQYSPSSRPAPPSQPLSPGPSPVKANDTEVQGSLKTRPSAMKRNTWANGIAVYGAPMPILPSIRPISPLSNTITAQAHAEPDLKDPESTKRIGRQLSLLSRAARPLNTPPLDAEHLVTRDTGQAPQSSGQKEGFFSHLRKRARRISGRHQFPTTPRSGDLEANAGCGPPWAGGRVSMLPDLPAQTPSDSSSTLGEADQIVQSINARPQNAATPQHGLKSEVNQSSNPLLKRHHSLPQSQESQQQLAESGVAATLAMSSTRVFRVARKPVLSARQYDTPDEQEELLDEALASAHAAVALLHHQHSQQQPRPLHQCPPIGSRLSHDPLRTLETRPPLRMAASETLLHMPYPTPSTGEKRHTINFENFASVTQPMDICSTKQRNDSGYPFPTPPYDDNEWAAAAAAAIIGAGDQWR